MARKKKEHFDLNRKKFTRISDSIKKEKLVLRKYKEKKVKKKLGDQENHYVKLIKK